MLRKKKRDRARKAIDSLWWVKDLTVPFIGTLPLADIGTCLQIFTMSQWPFSKASNCTPESTFGWVTADVFWLHVLGSFNKQPFSGCSGRNEWHERKGVREGGLPRTSHPLPLSCLGYWILSIAFGSHQFTLFCILCPEQVLISSDIWIDNIKEGQWEKIRPKIHNWVLTILFFKTARISRHCVHGKANYFYRWAMHVGVYTLMTPLCHVGNPDDIKC